MFKILLLGLFYGFSVNAVIAACLTQKVIQPLVAGYPTTPVKGLSEIGNLEEAYCTQKSYVALLLERGGEIAGYKIGFTGKASQARFKMKGPATGVLLDHMFLADNSVVNKHFGYRPLIEPDFMVVINDTAIMQSKSARDTLAFIASVHPLLELPAVQLHPDEAMSGYSMVALNIAATYMVYGEGIAVQNSDRFFADLGKVQTVFHDESGEQLQTAGSDLLMGHPLNALFWLIDNLRQRGQSLNAGDKISLGATGKLFPISSNAYRYEFKWPSGEIQQVSVAFQ